MNVYFTLYPKRTTSKSRVNIRDAAWNGLGTVPNFIQLSANILEHSLRLEPATDCWGDTLVSASAIGQLTV